MARVQDFTMIWEDHLHSTVSTRQWPQIKAWCMHRGFAIYCSFLPSGVSSAILMYKLITYSKLLQWLAVNQSPFADFHLASIHRQNPWPGTRYTLQGDFQSPHNFTSDFDQKLPPFFFKRKKLLTFEITGTLEELFTLKKDYYSRVYTSVFKNN